MATIDNLVQDFLAQKIIAVVGVSDKRETGAHWTQPDARVVEDVGSLNVNGGTQ